ncbi:MAG: radical SAM/SPASM domain-containing protein [Thermodesulfobacteriota bacterium]
MKEIGKGWRRTAVPWLCQKAGNLLPVLVEKALGSNTLQGIFLDHLENKMLDELRASADPRRPFQVLKDQEDMALALIKSFRRALERRQISRLFLQGLLQNLLTLGILREREDLKAAEYRFAQRHEGQEPPRFLVISPTKACNLRCVGCYASADTRRGQELLEWELFDRILSEAKTLWSIRFFTLSGGEPLLYRSAGKGLLDMITRHSDCFFLMFTNGTLIDQATAERMAGAGNLIPAISVEGFQGSTDDRRGPGTFRRVLDGMAHLRKAGVPFGISLTATRKNAEQLLAEEFIDFFFEEQQAVFGWIFQYMPIGRDYDPQLVVSPDQRLWMWRRTWQIIRERKIMLADFWNCGTVSNGCIAAGRSGGGGYLYIDWNGKVMPCVFVPYSAGNIREIYARGGTIDDIYDASYFRAIRQWQWEYALGKEKPEECGNWLIPCSFRDHYEIGKRLIEIYRPEPEDEAAGRALKDEAYSHKMIRYNKELSTLFDPIWEREYLGTRPSLSIEKADLPD